MNYLRRLWNRLFNRNRCHIKIHVNSHHDPDRIAELTAQVLKDLAYSPQHLGWY